MRQDRKNHATLRVRLDARTQLNRPVANFNGKSQHQHYPPGTQGWLDFTTSIEHSALLRHRDGTVVHPTLSNRTPNTPQSLFPMTVAASERSNTNNSHSQAALLRVPTRHAVRPANGAGLST